MQNIYITEHSNDVHQLMVSVSRHYFITSNGKYKQQKKKFEAQIDKPDSFTKRHAVNYMIRDHFSGLYYAELTDTNNIFSVSEFLYRAWSKKQGNSLYGAPLSISVPKTVRTVWPKLVPFLEEMEIIVIDVTSGFHGGIRDIRTWEEYLRSGPYKTGFPPDFTEVVENSPRAYEWYQREKFNTWQEDLGDEVYYPSSKEDFVL